ncbi:helix-turn-helix transcriptional regulator [Xanthobacteraceae bacterium A53D]
MQTFRTPQAAQYVGLSASTMNKLRHYGTGPAYLKLGAAVVYRQDDLDVWLETRRRTCTWGAANDNTPGHARAA